ncbi:5 [Fructobacillus evanidus]|uniref:methylenetetrahydrofolate reductase n=1 Tax=Fructobacillus evanidus TaxID=3064281 RepID=UPI002DA2B21A|nr:5 [Fructobacillus sp. LMG 32999] [Fructobacillus sp. LMG 32999]
MHSVTDFYQDHQGPVISQELTIKNGLKGACDRNQAQYYSLANQGKTDHDWQTLLKTATKIQLTTKKPVMVHVRAKDVQPDQVGAAFHQLEDLELNNFLLVTGDKRADASGFSSAQDLLLAVHQTNLAELSLATTLDVNQVANQGVAWVVNQALAKERAGAQVLISQIFFDVDNFLAVQEGLKMAGSNLILVAGVLHYPSQNQLDWVQRVLRLTVPDDWRKNPDLASARLIADLTDGQAAGIHYFANF